MEVAAKRFAVVSVAFLFLSLWMETSAIGQTRYLAKKITVNLASVPLDQALMAIEKEGNFSFSYNADLLNTKKIVSVHAENTNVERILKDLLGKQFSNKEVGNHVILVRNTPSPGDEYARKEEYTISGVIYDAATRKVLPDATVYEVEKKNSALSSATGNYAVNIPGERQFAAFATAKPVSSIRSSLSNPPSTRKLMCTSSQRRRNLRTWPLSAALSVSSASTAWHLSTGSFPAS